MSGLKQDNHVPTKEMFSPSIGLPFYRAAMGKRCLCFFLRALRFDNMDTREERKKTDRFASIREIWDRFISNCTARYSPGENITISKQLLSFRASCLFRMYITNKPAKYGIKLIMVCDAKSHYMLNAVPYLGKHTQPPHGISLGHHVTTKLITPYANTKRYITGDRQLVYVCSTCKDLLENYSLTYVGTVRGNKIEIPPQMIDKSRFASGQSAFVFDKNMTMVTYLPQKKLLERSLSCCCLPCMTSPSSRRKESQT